MRHIVPAFPVFAASVHRLVLQVVEVLVLIGINGPHFGFFAVLGDCKQPLGDLVHHKDSGLVWNEAGWILLIDRV